MDLIVVAVHKGLVVVDKSLSDTKLLLLLNLPLDPALTLPLKFNPNYVSNS